MGWCEFIYLMPSVFCEHLLLKPEFGKNSPRPVKSFHRDSEIHDFNFLKQFEV